MLEVSSAAFAWSVLAHVGLKSSLLSRSSELSFVAFAEYSWRLEFGIRAVSRSFVQIPWRYVSSVSSHAVPYKTLAVDAHTQDSKAA